MSERRDRLLSSLRDKVGFDGSGAIELTNHIFDGMMATGHPPRVTSIITSYGAMKKGEPITDLPKRASDSAADVRIPDFLRNFFTAFAKVQGMVDGNKPPFRGATPGRCEPQPSWGVQNSQNSGS